MSHVADKGQHHTMTLLHKRLDVSAIIKRFGGKTKLHRALHAMDYPASKKAIEKWTERKTIPTRRILQLMALAQGQGRAFSLDKYLLTPTPPTPCADSIE